MAVVVDEFGSALGLITTEDIIEEVVGDMDVGYDFEEYLPHWRRVYERLDEEVYLMDARLPLSGVNDILGVTLSSSESHSLGGLLLSRLRHISTEGEYAVEAGYRFTVVQASERAVRKARVEPEPLASEPG